MIVTRTFDSNLIKSFLAEDYNTLAGDDYPSFDCWQPDLNKNTCFFILAYSTKKAGLFIFTKQNPILVECNICIPRKYRGDGSSALGKAAMEFMRNNFCVKKFVAYIPEDKYLANRYAKRCGFKEIGRITNSFMRKGQLLSMDIMESD